MTSLERYEWARTTPSDIAEHIPTLFRYGKQCSHVTEFGIRGGVSTSAWLHARPMKLVCYDINIPACLGELSSIAGQNGVDFKFIQADTSKVVIENTELLFLDTLHTRDHIKLELRNYCLVSGLIVCHDTEIFDTTGEDGKWGSGIGIAVREFLNEHPSWKVKEHYVFGNGLTILERL